MASYKPLAIDHTSNDCPAYLQVSTANLDDLFEVLRLDCESITKFCKGGDEGIVDFGHSGDVHSGGEAAIIPTSVQYPATYPDTNQYVRIVAALTHVDMVVRVHWLLRAALAAENLNCTV